MKLSNYRKQIVFLMDLAIIIVVSMLIFLLTPLGNGTGGRNLVTLFFNLAILIACIALFQLLFRTYNSLWRYAEAKEYIALLMGFGCGALLYILLTKLFFERQLSGLFMVASLGTSLIFMLLVRFVYSAYRKRLIEKKNVKTQNCHCVAIIGAGVAGVSLFTEIQHSTTLQTAMFFDDDPNLIGMKISGVPVSGPIDDLPELLHGTDISDIILAIPSLKPERRKEILAMCTATQCRLRILPDRLSMIEKGNGVSLLTKMRNVQVEDLLGRELIKLENDKIRPMVEGHTVMVTGGGGSIGSELCRQIASNNPKCLIILDNYENSTYELQQELLRKYGNTFRLVVKIISVQDEQRVRSVFMKYRPEIVFHAAAHKHVPLMEANPAEAVKNNVFG
ncbi:MAG: polysaccharide biosynthesis protein, partial [Clostridia bacterium]